MIIGSFQAFYNIAKANPDLFNIGALRGLLQSVDALKVQLQGKGCASCAARSINMDQYRAGYEQAFESLAGDDLAALKKLLKTDSIEYYIKDPITKLTKAVRK